MKAVILFAIFALAYGQEAPRTVTEDLLAAQAVSRGRHTHLVELKNILIYELGFISRT